MTRGVLVFRLVGAALAIAAIALMIGLHGPATATGDQVEQQGAQADTLHASALHFTRPAEQI